ncbi:glycosyl transferase, group 1 [Methanolobus psychrophilus R15]|nr:glycosyl transferase, group 1 [Methanolobus psychrophilus R15]
MKDNINLIFYYPLSTGAPSAVGRNIFLSLLELRDELPFNDISIFSSSQNKEELKKKFQDIHVYTGREIVSVKNSDIIHIPLSPHLFPNSKFLLHLYSKINKNSLILNYHGEIRTEVNLNYKHNHIIDYSYIPTYLALPQLLKSSDQLIVNSYLFKTLVTEKYGVKTPKVIPNGIEDFWYLQECNSLCRDESHFEVFYHGRLSPEKGVDLLIKGFSKFLSVDNVKSAFLYIAGSGPQEKHIAKLVHDLNLKANVFLLGNVGKETIKNYLEKVNLAIYPSIWDNVPISCIEAFASANCPVYFSRKAGIYDFTVMGNHQLCSFEPSVDTIFEVLHNSYLNAFDEALIKRQKCFASAYRWNYVIGDYIDVYSQFLERDVK